MNRAFVSLYLVIVASVIFIGFGLDAIWQKVAVENAEKSEAERLIDTISFSLDSTLKARWAEEVSGYAEHLQLDVKLIDSDRFAKNSALSLLQQGQAVAVMLSDGSEQMIKKIPNSDSLIALTIPQSQSESDAIYSIFLLIFYSGIALAVFLWVRPIANGLKQLECQLEQVGGEVGDDSISVSRTSPVYPVAFALNTMAKRIQDLLATNKEMTYAISHELRTPLARMKFALQIAEEAEDKESALREIVGVKSDVMDMENLISSLLNYAAFDASNTKLMQKPGDLAFLIESIIANIRQSNIGGPREKISYRFNKPDNDSEVYCEWALMERVLTNLIQNASRFAVGQVAVSYAFSSAHRVEIVVEDDGPGVPESERQNVFNSFVRLNNAVNGETRGFGLGLALCQRIVDWHNGEICVGVSDLGGAKFLVAWPWRKDT